MISSKRVYWDAKQKSFSFDVPDEGFLVCAANGEVPREFWSALTEWLADQKGSARPKQTKSVRPAEDK